jgi:hydrogenase-1 operon protein HyaE
MHDHVHDTDLAPPAAVHPLIARLSADLGWPVLADMAAVHGFIARPGAHCLFVPGDPRRNLESADAAVILPELRIAFQHAFDCAVVADAVETEVRETFRALRTPGLLFFRDGAALGTIEKVRDWADYTTRITHFLSRHAA